METLPLDMLLSLGLGMAFALAQGDRETEKPVLKSTYFLVGLAVHFVLAFGVALLCYILEPDWMWMYFTSHEAVPVAIVVYVFLGYFALYALGFLLTKAIGDLSRSAAWVSFAACLAFIAAFIGLTFHRLWYVGTARAYEMLSSPIGASYQLHPAKAMTGTPLFWILLIAMPGAVIILLIALWLLRRHFDAGGGSGTPVEATGA